MGEIPTLISIILALAPKAVDLEQKIAAIIGQSTMLTDEQRQQIVDVVAKHAVDFYKPGAVIDAEGDTIATLPKA